MNVCFYTQQDITPYTGGIGRITSVLTEYFRKNFHWKVYSLYAEFSPEKYDKTETDGQLQGRLHDRYGMRRGIKANTKKAALFIKEHNVNVVIVQTSLDVVKKLRRATQRIGYDVKIIGALHFLPGSDIWAKPIPLHKAVITALTRRAYRNAYKYGEKVVLLSPQYIGLYKEFAGIADNDKFAAIPNALSFSETYDAESINLKKDIALVVGRMSEKEKRISLILDIWGEYEKQCPESGWQLCIVGDGKDLDGYKQRAKSLKLKNCTFTGSRNPVPFYKDAKLFLMTSNFEGFPMTLIEAQQFGAVPIAINTFAALTDVVTDGRNGIIVPKDDAEGFLKSMTDLMDNPEKLREMAANAISDCRRFSQQNVCKKWKELIENIAG